jgi:hypothetical protein
MGGVGYKGQGTRHKVQGTRHKVQGTRHKAQGTRHKAQGTRHKAQGTRHKLICKIQPFTAVPLSPKPSTLNLKPLKPIKIKKKLSFRFQTFYRVCNGGFYGLETYG